MKWRKGENPALDSRIEAALHADNVKRAARGQGCGQTPAEIDKAIAEANARAKAGGGARLRGRRWSSAVPTVGGDGIRYASKMEARVADLLLAHMRPGERLVRQASFPLLGLEPGRDGKVKRFTPDFTIVSAHEPDDFVSSGWTYLGAEWFHSPTKNGKHAKAERGVWVRFIEAKGGRRSRDYELRRDAFSTVFGPVIEWDGGGSAENVTIALAMCPERIR